MFSFSEEKGPGIVTCPVNRQNNLYKNVSVLHMRRSAESPPFLCSFCMRPAERVDFLPPSAG